MDYYQRMARVHFTIRALERRHDPDAVRACFDSLVRAAKLLRSSPSVGHLRSDASMPEHRRLAKFDAGDLTLQSGAVLRGARLSWKTHGTLSPADDNVT